MSDQGNDTINTVEEEACALIKVNVQGRDIDYGDTGGDDSESDSDDLPDVDIDLPMVGPAPPLDFGRYVPLRNMDLPHIVTHDTDL